MRLAGAKARMAYLSQQFERGVRPGTASLTLGALGVVFGDIGTSPLYALRVCFAGSYQVPLTTEHVLGILSLLFSQTHWCTFIIFATGMRVRYETDDNIPAHLFLTRHMRTNPAAVAAITTISKAMVTVLRSATPVAPAATMLKAPLRAVWFDETTCTR